MRALTEWQPVTGCSPASAGCANCVAMRVAQVGLTIPSRAGPVWTGDVRFDRLALAEPVRMSRPRLYAVCSHGDLFHRAVPDAWIDAVVSTMERCHRHAFQVLTKRAERMGTYLRARYAGRTVPANVAYGVSVERQREAEERIPHLQNAPVAVRFLALYPLLGPIDLTSFLALQNRERLISSVLAGDEVERPANPVWFGIIEAQCALFGVPFARSRLLDSYTVADQAANLRPEICLKF